MSEHTGKVRYLVVAYTAAALGNIHGDYPTRPEAAAAAKELATAAAPVYVVEVTRFDGDGR